MAKRLLVPILAVTLAAPLFVNATAAARPDPGPRDHKPVREFGNGPERNATAGRLPDRLRGLDHKTFPRPEHKGYPRRTRLTEPPVNPDDRSIKLGLTPYHGIAPKLNALQRRSDRVSAEVIGRSHEGREMYLVTVTAPENAGEARQQGRMRSKIVSDPARAARDPRIAQRYKAPVFINNNIHGDEWEGTDASLRLIEELATARDSRTKKLVSKSRLYFSITNNPDGRVAGRRTNAAGFDLNRDYVTGSQPEGRATRQVMIDTQPLVMLDQHGYVNGTLIEPTTPPHGQNYEYDLFITHTWNNGVNMEKAVNGLGFTPEKDGVSPAQIPFRDLDEGWDDWPPIFTPQYAPFQGVVASSTIEFPLRVNRGDYDNLPVEELRRRSKINTDISAATIDATFDYVQQSREELIADQIEGFRRGAAGEPQRPAEPGHVPGFGEEDVYTTTFPRAYVIPSGRAQRSEPAAARLVDHLIANDVEVRRATRRFRLGGTTYPAGSYIVDMHQAKRGMANVMLEAGGDISDRVDTMYDISGWSHAYLWGATVRPIHSGSLRGVFSRPVHAAAPTGWVSPHGDLALALTDAKDIAALNDLLAEGVEARWSDDGTVIIPGAARGAARTVADRYGVRFTKARGTGAVPLRRLKIAAAAASDELYTLAEMGFEVEPVSTAVLNDGFDLSDVDALYVSSGLDHGSLNEDAREELDEFLTRGGVVTRGATGAAFNGDAGLLEATANAGRRDANGVVAVDNAGGPISDGAPDSAFAYSPGWFTDLGEDVAVEQRYAATGPLISGHWRADPDGTGGQDAAAGMPSVVRGTAPRGAGVVLFSTEPLFRNHPKGMFPQVARALFWSSSVARR